jgi:hypothetical protein
MWKRWRAWYEAKKPVVQRVWFEAWRPLIPAVIWAVAVVWWYQGKSLLDSFSAGFTAFFFIFFLQGQVLRVHKNVEDKKNADRWDDSFASIQQALVALRQQPSSLSPIVSSSHRSVEIPTPPIAFDVRDDIGSARAVREDLFRSRAYFRQARTALDHKLYYPAILAAAVGFEHALRQTAKIIGLDRRSNLGLVIAELAKRSKNKNIEGELRVLLRLRNGLVHGETHVSLSDYSEAENVIRAFEHGIDYLEALLVSLSGPERF